MHRRFLWTILSFLLFTNLCFATGGEPIDSFNLPKENIPNLSYKIIGEPSIANSIDFYASYSHLPGILNFRGGPTRTHPSYGYIHPSPSKLVIDWSSKTSSSTWGGGSGWTGQPVLVTWNKEQLSYQNIYGSYKHRDYVTEAICGSLDGHVYFYDMYTGEETRPPVDLHNPIKGSVSLDPRGFPLLYVGEGIPEQKPIGLSIIDLTRGKVLYKLKGVETDAPLGWGAFDSSATVYEDILIAPGENGLIYFAKLNSNFNKVEGEITISPEIMKYKYAYGNQYRFGVESSAAFYRHLMYFCDNTGYVQCLNLKTMKPVWIFDNKDDTDATPLLSIEDEHPYLYVGSEVDIQPIGGSAYIHKLDALTGKVIWSYSLPCHQRKKQKDSKAINGGIFATGIVGKDSINHMVVFTLARQKTFWGSTMIALDKKTGSLIWERELTHYAWSSPVDLYDKGGNAYIIQCNYAGHVLLLDALSGDTITTANLGRNIESSPAVYNGHLVIGVRGNYFYKLHIE